MFRVLYKAIFKAAIQKAFFDIQLVMPLKYETLFTLECKI